MIKRQDRHLVRWLLDRQRPVDFKISVWDGEVWQVRRSRSEKEIMEAIRSVDECQLRVHTPDPELVGWVQIVHENAESRVNDYAPSSRKEPSFLDDWFSETEDKLA